MVERFIKGNYYRFTGDEPPRGWGHSMCYALTEVCQWHGETGKTHGEMIPVFATEKYGNGKDPWKWGWGFKLDKWVEVKSKRINEITEEKKMELNEVSKESLLEAKKLYDEERKKAEVKYALDRIRELSEERDKLECEVDTRQDKISEINEQLKLFDTPKRGRKK